jgi:hypothetical protein
MASFILVLDLFSPFILAAFLAVTALARWLCRRRRVRMPQAELSRFGEEAALLYRAERAGPLPRMPSRSEVYGRRD